ncbi:hypothetical protein DFQ28_004279 [Apophysomyces sp. BC1034]|nr:hypothetical protein DFQ30_003610 [Apophysomyces sp. BC1015]KAG0182011.1 hypothetical protein DFQ29_006129 [Apophysomyces sp. BC1021]KAG0193612.1 hypothetical protein DFQ28_004279 [Apophysomyces sp. BC1034]
MQPIPFVYLLSLFSLAQALPIKRAEYSGSGTFYNVGLGSCGVTSKDSQPVAALSSDLMQSGQYCGKKITISSGTKSVTVTVVDTCPACSKSDVDLSIAAFKEIGDPSKGRIPIKWSTA